MKLKTMILLSFIILCLFPFSLHAAIYNYYFSSMSAGNPAGNDETGNGSQDRPWLSLSKARKEINALSSSDTANLYFDRGDTWLEDTAVVSKTINWFLIDTNDPIVNIDAYGSGNNPVFDGSVTDFAVVPSHNAVTGPLKWSRFFEFQRPNCSMSNIEIKGVYAHAIYLNNADGFKLSHSYVHNFGNSGIMNNYKYGVENSVVEYSTFHTGQELYRFSKISGWGGAIDFNAAGYGAASMCKNNRVHHCLIYNIFGEGISNSNGITEYNIVGDTGSVALNPSVQDYDALSTTVRYNLVTHSNWDTSVYDNHRGGDKSGARVYDEKVGGDNSNAKIEIYGNIFINRGYGIRFYCSTVGDSECNNPYGSVEIHNNLVIDSHGSNFFMRNPEEVYSGKFYANSSILYDRTTSTHIQDFDQFSDASNNFIVNNNHFWTAGGSPFVKPYWQKNFTTSDPKLLGEPSIDWDGQMGATYFKNINPVEHLNPPSDSPVFDLTPILTMDMDVFLNNLDRVIISPDDFKRDAK